MTLKTECIGEPGQNTPSIWDEMEKAREKRKAMVTICVEETGQKLKVESRYATPIIEAIEIFCDLKSGGFERYEDIRCIADILSTLNQVC